MNRVNKKEIEKIVDSAFDRAFEGIRPAVNRELYPAAFVDEYSWLHVKNVFDLQNAAIRKAVKEALSDILSEQS